jgi:exodeoxyribonuclease-5
MVQKGCEGAQTLHSLIYQPRRLADGTLRFVRNPNSDIAAVRLAVVDESSMIGDDLYRDLLSFSTPILLLGDPAQLPPVHEGRT